MFFSTGKVCEFPGAAEYLGAVCTSPLSLVVTALIGVLLVASILAFAVYLTYR